MCSNHFIYFVDVFLCEGYSVNRLLLHIVILTLGKSQKLQADQVNMYVGYTVVVSISLVFLTYLPTSFSKIFNRLLQYYKLTLVNVFLSG